MYPRETVERALRLSAQGLFDRQVAELCGVSIGTVRNWRTGVRHARSDRSHGRAHTCPRCDDRELDEVAYAHLLGLYLGDGHLLERRRKVYQISIFCDDNWPGLIEEAARAMAQTMPTSSVSRRRRRGCTEVRSYAKHWVCLFPQHGPGKKHDRRIEPADWQQQIVAPHPGMFARGLFHSDGCRGINRIRRELPSGVRWYEYPRYHFKNKSPDILALCGQALGLLGVAWRFNNRYELSVARREAVELLDVFVGPKY